MILEDNPVRFNLFNASAGSGKTFLLVQKYIHVLLENDNDDHFHRMLALTFTNKAVYEMKSRIISTLDLFSKGKAIEDNVMAKNLMQDLNLTVTQLINRSRQLLRNLLHDYAAFDVITLDRFTHRVIRSFAKDLGLSYDFEVELYEDPLLEETVTDLIDMVGTDPEITTILEQFTFDKMDDEGLSWDLKNQLFNVAKLLLREKDRAPLQEIKVKSRQEIKAEKAFLKNKQADLKKQLVDIGNAVMACFLTHGLTADLFLRKTLYTKFEKLAKGDFQKYDQGQLYTNLQEGKGIYKKGTPSDKIDLIEDLIPFFLKKYEDGLSLFRQWELIKDLGKQQVPLSLLTLLSKLLDHRQKEHNKVLISTFNEKIQQEVLNNPTPFIYERLGENYRHYFIDEFQDTSTLQWKNLIPLIESALQSEDEKGKTGDLLLVGDPKQSIYRWRGGNVDQFISLLDKGNPFQVKKEVHCLSKNYRSCKTIVDFNNKLYTTLKGTLAYEENKNLFGEKAYQEMVNEKEGLVNLDFFIPIEGENLYLNYLLKRVNNCISDGFTFSDMAILVRKKAQAQEIAHALSKEGIPFISSDSLLLSGSNYVEFLIGLFVLKENTDDIVYKKNHLSFLYDLKERKIDKHNFILENLSLPLFEFWKIEGIDFNFSLFEEITLFSVAEVAIEVFFNLVYEDPFLNDFLDLVYDFSLQEKSTTKDFLLFWEKQGHLKTVAMPESSNGIRLLTIHQSKGLEFPVVFFPYADEVIHQSHQEKVWLDTQEFFGDQYPLGWISYSKRLEQYGDIGYQTYHKKRREVEIDAWNTFYVATTRATTQLYMIANREKAKTLSYATHLSNFLQSEGFDLTDETFFWGKKSMSKEHSPSIPAEEDRFLSEQIKKKTHPYKKQLLAYSSDIQGKEERLYGNLLHDLLAKITYASEVEFVVEEALSRGEIALSIKKSTVDLIQKIVFHEKLAPYFNLPYTVKNEQSLLLKERKIIRPDRIVYNEHHAVVMDYKTGKKSSSHIAQINQYCTHVNEILQRPVLGILVYFSPTSPVEIVEVT